jgi:autotransporter family porin
MKRQLMNAVAGALTLSIALGAGGAANAAAARTLPAPRPASAGYRLADDKLAAAHRPRAKGKARSSGTRSWAGATFTAAEAGRAAVHVLNAAKVALTGCVIRKNGPGAAVLADTPGLVVLNGCAITTAGGADGVAAAGPGSDIRIANSTIRVETGSHAALAGDGGRITLENVNVVGGGLRGGRLAVHGGTITAGGSAVLQSDGLITAHGVTGTTLGVTGTAHGVTGTALGGAEGEHAAVIDGPHGIDAIDSALTGPAGVLFSGAGAGTATYKMAGGSLTAATGPAFEVRGATARVTVRGGAAIAAGDGVLARVSDGGVLTLTASGQGLRGDVIAGSGSAASLVLRHGSALTGTITNGAVELDADSTWYVTGDSTVTRLTGAIGSIISNGHTVHATDGTVLVPQNGNHLSL